MLAINVLTRMKQGLADENFDIGKVWAERKARRLAKSTVTATNS